MRIVGVIFALMFLFSCTPRSEREINRVSEERENEKSNFHYLFEKTTNSGCIAAYSNDGLLYFVSRELGYSAPYFVRKNSNEKKTLHHYLHVYDKNTSMISFVILNDNPYFYRNIESCSDIPFAKIPTFSRASLTYVRDSGIREVFDNYNIDIDELEEMVFNTRYLLGNNFRKEGMVISIPEYFDEIRSVDDLPEKFFRNRDKLKMISSAREYEYARKKKKEEDRKNRRQAAVNLWRTRHAAVYNRGDKVCTREKNYFGYVEDWNSEKLKVFVVGQVQLYDGFFFDWVGDKYNYVPIESIRWFTKNEIAHCEFK